MDTDVNRAVKRWLARKSVFRPIVKWKILRSYNVSLRKQTRAYLRYLLFDKETTNFTYDLENVGELKSFIATAAAVTEEKVEQYLREIRRDEVFLDPLAKKLQSRGDRNDKPKFGRRLGWYCLVRIFKPKIAVETGTHDGLGTALLAQALQHNAEEGFPGELHSFDMQPGSGWLLDSRLRRYVELHIGDVREELPRALEGRKIGLFIHDSEHTYEHERFEFSVALEHAAERLILISDNAHASDALRDLCAEISADFYYFHEQPIRHFYPGAAIGLAISDGSVSRTSEDG